MYSLSNKFLKVMAHFRHLRLPLSPVRSANKSRWRYDSCCFAFVFPCHADWRMLFSSARIVLPPVSGAMRHVPAKDVKSMVSRIRVWTACARPGKWESNAVLTNVKAKFHLLLRQLHTQVSSPPRANSMPYLTLF